MKAEFSRPLVERLRRLCLAFPDATETASWGHPNFRAGRRTFTAFEIVQGRPSIAFRVSPDDAAALVRRRQFFATPYGRGQWVSLWADEAVDWKRVSTLVERSYRRVATRRMLAVLDARLPS